MIRRALPLVTYMIRVHGTYRFEYEDALAIGRLAVVEAVDRYVPDRHAEHFSGYICGRINSALIDAARSRDHTRRVGEPLLTTPVGDGEFPVDWLPDERTSSPDLRITVDQVLAEFPRREQFIFYAVILFGYRQRAVGEILGISESRVNQLLMRPYRAVCTELAA